MRIVKKEFAGLPKLTRRRVFTITICRNSKSIIISPPCNQCMIPDLVSCLHITRAKNN